MTIQTSLQEVADLLIVLHDEYLQDADGAAVLYQLLKLLHDLSLTEDICILDVERIRLKVMSHNGNEQTMSYESFYEWLREASVFIFRKFDEAGNRALSLLLTKYIIPFATKEKEGKFAFVVLHTNGRDHLDEASLKALIPYGDFLRLWFTSGTFHDNLRLTPMHNFALRAAYQFPSAQQSSTIFVDMIFHTLKSSGVLPIEMHPSLFVEMALAASATRDIRGEGDALNCLAFPGFLLMLESVSNKVNLGEAQTLGMAVTAATKLAVLLQRLSETLLNSTFQRFTDHEIKIGEQSSIHDSYSKGARDFDDRLSPTILPSLTTISVLWLARQAGLTQIPGLTLNALLDELISCADVSRIQADGQRAHAWSISQLPLSLCQIAESHTIEKSSDKSTGLTGISSLGRVALLLAQYIPAIFFASPVRSPLVLMSLYTPQCIRQLYNVSPLVDSFFRAISALPRGALLPPADSDLPSLAAASRYGLRKIDSISFKDFIDLCALSGVTPHLLSVALVRETCEYLLGFHLVDDSIDVQVLKNDWIEILFTLAQICFKDYNGTKVMQSETTIIADESVGKLSDLLKCFSSVVHLPHALNRLRKGPDLQSFLSKYIPLKSVVKWELSSSPHAKRFANEKSNLLSPVRKTNNEIHVPTRGKCESSNEFKSSFPVTESNDKDPTFSLKQILISLLHYPHNSFDLNPWTLYRILLDSVNSETDPGSNTEFYQGSDRENVISTGSKWQRTAIVFQSFCSQFNISFKDLTQYFASFYKTDYFVSDITQMYRLRDVEAKYGMPASPFNLNSDQSYTKQIKVIKPSLQGLMASPVFELLFSDKVILFLSSNCEILYWEFSRACALLRSSDPFTRDLNTPLPSIRTMKSVPWDCRMTVASALEWANETTELNRTEATLQLKRTILLSGHSGITSGYLLTFSGFLLFSIHCFSAHALLCAPIQGQELLDVFEVCLHKMVNSIKARLKAVQQSLPLSISLLTSIFRHPSDKSLKGRICAAERLILARHSLLEFDVHVRRGFSSPDTNLPPRPPPILWDACRFLEFCCFYGIIEHMGSLMVPLKGFKRYLSAVNLSSLGPSEECVLALTPVRATTALIVTMLDEITKNTIGLSEDNFIDLIEELLPIMLSMMNLTTTQPTSQVDSSRPNATEPTSPVDSSRLNTTVSKSRGVKFEDIIRYGGDDAMMSFSHSEHYLHEAYSSLVITSSLVVPTLPRTLASDSPQYHDDHDSKECNGHTERSAPCENVNGREALLSVICTYLSCSGLIQPLKIAKIAKRSLHSRIRPMIIPFGIFSEEPSSESKHSSCMNDIVTVSFTEFEEMFLRCAFSCWESSGAMSGVGDLEPCPITLLSACSISTGKRDQIDTENAVYKYCIEGMQVVKKDVEEDDSGTGSSITPSWGTDFVGPYARTLFALSPLPNQVALAAAARDREMIETQLKEEQILLEREREARHLLLEQNLREQKVLQKKKFELGRKYVDSYMLLREPITAMVTDERIPGVDKMQALLDMTEYLKSPSLGINLLIDGTKEELWPVYATYCSCGDSTDPGKLSGPNLFTLLSKLDIFDDHTALSDVGILLHQISAHLHSQSPVSLASVSSSESMESPSLSFEQFLVFLCAYSEQFFHPNRDSPTPIIVTSNTPTVSLSDPKAVKREAIRLLYEETRENIHSPYMGILPVSKPTESISNDTNCRESPFRTPGRISPYGQNKSPPSSFIKRREGGPPCLDVIISSNSASVGGNASLSRLWLVKWRDYMNSSSTFRSLLENQMLPVLRGHTLLAFPNDARHRDKYAVLFSLEVLLTMQRIEPVLRLVFLTEGVTSWRESEDFSRHTNIIDSLQMQPILSALRRINLVPQVLPEADIQQLMKDVMPECPCISTSTSTSMRSMSSTCHDEVPNNSVGSFEDTNRDRGGKRDKDSQKHGELLFCHWEWVVCVVAYEATESAVRLSSTRTDPEVYSLPGV